VKITTDPIQATPADTANTPANQAKNDRTSTASIGATTSQKPANAAAASSTNPIDPSTDVTVRRDTNGRVYYMVSDANSGQEILEIPPKALRDVGQGIEDYLKEVQSKATSHVKVKA
jgi:uncharacterized FlaG/YvyC family protein